MFAKQTFAKNLEKTPKGHSIGDNFATICILLSKGNGTIRGPEIQTRERKTINSVIIGIYFYGSKNKFRKLHTQLYRM